MIAFTQRDTDGSQDSGSSDSGSQVISTPQSLAVQYNPEYCTPSLPNAKARDVTATDRASYTALQEQASSVRRRSRSANRIGGIDTEDVTKSTCSSLGLFDDQVFPTKPEDIGLG